MKITYKPLPIPDICISRYLTTVPFAKANVDAFKQAFHTWIHSSKNTVIHGLELFSTALTDGVTGAFTDFTHAYPDRTTTVLKGEYPFHRDTGARVIKNADDIKETDKVIISMPFSASGNKHEQFDSVLDRCDELNVPVFIDCAYFGCCKLDSFNVDRPCIKMIAFSLSKTFGTGKSKIGLCYYRDITSTPMQILNDYNYINHTSILLHVPIIENFSADYMYDTYRDKQLKIAHLLGVEPSATVFLCTSHDERYNGFNRAGTINRIGISELLVEDVIDVASLEWHEKP